MWACLMGSGNAFHKRAVCTIKDLSIEFVVCFGIFEIKFSDHLSNLKCESLENSKRSFRDRGVWG